MAPTPCSGEERAAIDSLAARLGEAGYVVDVEAFPSHSSSAPWLASYAALSVVAALLIYAVPLVAAALGGIAVVLHARESEGRPLVRRWTGTSHNVVARSPVAAVPEAVVVAHVDSAPHSAFDGHARRALVVTLQTLMAGVPAAAAAAWVAEAGRELPSSVAAAGVAAAVALALLTLVLYRPPAPNELAVEPSAADVLVALAPALRESPAWLVGTGSRTAGMIGMQAFLAAHAREVAGAAWLNLEAGPPGSVVAASEEGTWRERRADRGLMGAAEEAGADVRPYRAAPTDATVLLARRRRALTLLVPPGEQEAAAAIGTAVVAAALDAGIPTPPG